MVRRFLNTGADGGVVGYIDLDRQNSAVVPKGFGNFARGVASRVEECDRSALIKRRPRRCRSNPAGSACHDDSAAPETAHGFSRNLPVLASNHPAVDG